MPRYSLSAQSLACAKFFSSIHLGLPQRLPAVGRLNFNESFFT